MDLSHLIPIRTLGDEGIFIIFQIWKLGHREVEWPAIEVTQRGLASIGYGTSPEVGDGYSAGLPCTYGP